MAIQTLTHLVGLAKQTGKGAAAASPTYGLGLAGTGRAYNIPIDQEDAPLTLGGGANDRIAPASIRTGAHPGATFPTRVWPRSSPLLWYGALGTLATSGAGPFTHIASPGMDLPWLTLFGRNDAERVRIPDSKIAELTMSWDERSPLQYDVVLMGLVPALEFAAWTPTNDETKQTFFGPQGGTFQLDVDGTALAVAKVVGASVHVNNNLAERPLSASILPDDLVPARQVIDGTITLEPDDMADWQSVVTGTPAGAAVSESPIYGSFSLKVALDANTDIVLAANRTPFMAEPVEGNPEGGPGRLEFAFSVNQLTGAGDAFTATTRNGVASY